MSVLIEAGIFGKHIPGTKVSQGEKNRANKAYIANSDKAKSATKVAAQHVVNSGGDTEGKAAKTFQSNVKKSASDLAKSEKRKTGIENLETKQIDKGLTKTATKLLDKPKFAKKYGTTEGSPDLKAKLAQIKKERADKAAGVQATKVDKKTPKPVADTTNAPEPEKFAKPKKTKEQLQDQVKRIADRKMARNKGEKYVKPVKV